MIRVLAACGLFGLVAVAQDAPKPLKPGDAVPAAFRAFIAADERYEKGNPNNRVNKLHDPVTDNGLNPVLCAFVRSEPAADSPAAQLARQMSSLVADFKADRLGGFMIFLTLDKEYQEQENRDPKAEAVANLSTQLQSGNVPFGLAPRTSAATEAWGLGESDEIVVIYYNQMVVKQVWRFTADKPPTADDLKAIAEFVRGELKPKRK